MQNSIVKWFRNLPETQKSELKTKYTWMEDCHLLHFCPICNRYEGESAVLGESGYYVRAVYHQCKCGTKFQSVS